MSDSELSFQLDESGMVRFDRMKGYLLSFLPRSGDIGMLIAFQNPEAGKPDLQVQLTLDPHQAMSLGTRLRDLALERVRIQ